jgi:hypothetical protein
VKTNLPFKMLVLTALLSCPSVYADALPPEARDCWAKKVGDACTDLASKAAGSCEDGLCTSKKLDAGATTYGCLTCSGPPPTDDGACTIAKQSATRRLGPWLLAGSVSVLFLFGRRRRRS